MLAIQATENLTGARISGDYFDLDDLLTSIRTVIGEENHYYDYQGSRNRLLELAIKLRDAIEGEHHLQFVSNGVNKGILKGKKMLAPDKNLYFAVDILLPEIIFAAIALNDFVKLHAELVEQSIWNPAISTIRKFQSNVALFLKEFMPADYYTGFMEKMQLKTPAYYKYATQYVDYLNIEYLKLTKEQRTTSIAKFVISLVQEDQTYEALKKQLLQATSTSKHEIYELQLKLEYPEEIEW